MSGDKGACTPKNKLRYIVMPGYVFSDCDGDRHYITSDQLVKLYGLRVGEYLVGPHPKDRDGWRNDSELMELHPQSTYASYTNFREAIDLLRHLDTALDLQKSKEVEHD